MPKVSVVIPIYNVEKYLRECMDSVVNQTLKDIEIICVNDGSPDNSRSILQEYADKDERIKIIDKENGGLASARNVGVKAATGEYIGFVDSDDWIDLDFYEKLYNTAIQYEADIACGNIYKTGKKKYLVRHAQIRFTQKTRDKYRYARIPKHCYVWNKIYRRNALIRSGVCFEEGVCYEDIEFTHKVLHYLNSFVTVPNADYYYRTNPDSIVGYRTDKKYQDLVAADVKAQKFIKSRCRKVNLRNYKYLQRNIYKFLGITILKIQSNHLEKKYYLFGVIKFFTITQYKKINIKKGARL